MFPSDWMNDLTSSLLHLTSGNNGALMNGGTVDTRRPHISVHLVHFQQHADDISHATSLT